MSEYTITRRSRNIAYNWSNQPTGHGLEIATPTFPGKQYNGAFSQAASEMRKARHINDSVFWRDALFVNGERVVAVWGLHHDRDEMAWIIPYRIMDHIAWMLEDFGSVCVQTVAQ